MQWTDFQIYILDGHVEIQDGRHGTFVFIDILYKSNSKVVYCGLEIHAVIPKTL